jgi:hypothetical protein
VAASSQLREEAESRELRFAEETKRRDEEMQQVWSP